MKKGLEQVPRGPFHFLYITSKPHWRPALLAIFFVIVGSALATAVPYIFKRIIDAITSGGITTVNDVWFWAISYIGVGFSVQISFRASGFTGRNWMTSLRATARSMLSTYATKHSHEYFLNRFSGALGSKLTNASGGVKDMAGQLLWEWFTFILSLVFGLALIFYTNIYVGIIFFSWLLIVIPLNIFLAKKKIVLSTEAQRRETEVRAWTVDMLTNINAIHDFARRTFELKELFRLIDIRRLAGMRNWGYSEKILVLNNVLETLFVGGMILMSIYLWSDGVLTAGDIVLILTLVASLRGDLEFLGGGFNRFAQTIGEIREGLEEILEPHEVVDSPFATELRVSSGEILLEDVSFKYSEQDVFTNLNLHIKPGEKVGLVGRSGAGKSTLMKLLLRQYDIGGGKITIDGQDITLLTQESLRDSIAVVPQDPLLFHRSLKENIRYGKLEATEKEIEEAAEHAQAHDFVEKLPQKYNTLVGERGIKLSGGERQRIAIARAFLKDAKILLLDEATSSLDSESEVAIQEALHELMEGKTVLAIAHRLSTLRALDRIIVFDAGKVAEDGKHNQLIKKGGIYAELWSHQAGGFLREEEE
ncbi:MAG: ABC transporter ATP-binding protein [Candidatus Paceibacterota bacterium]